MKKGYRSEKGSITVFTLASCLFFLVSVIGVQTYTKNKQIAVENDYKQVKQSYEKDINNQAEIYNRIKDLTGDIGVNFESQEGYLIPTGATSCTISQKFTVDNQSNNRVQSVSFGWSIAPETEPTSWENASMQSLTHTANKEGATAGDYYLWVKVKHEGENEAVSARSVKITVYSDEITIGKSSSKAVITYPSTVTLYNKKIGQGETEQEAKNNLVNNTNSTINISSKVLYVETTDSHGNKISKNVSSSPIIEASEYGKEVNYGVTYQDETNGGSKWEIFYADNRNVYLITRGHLPAGTINVDGYGGTDDFLDSNKIKKYPSIVDGWLYEIYKDNTVLFSDTNNRMKATEYLLDSENVWNGLYKNNYGNWAIGAPTMELLVASYNAINKENQIIIQSVSEKGYYDRIFGSGTLPKDSIWVRNAKYWLASISGNQDDIRIVNRDNSSVIGFTYTSNAQFRPIVCLKSDVILTWNNSTNMYDLSM